jgi:hypothetical protein
VSADRDVTGGAVTIADRATIDGRNSYRSTSRIGAKASDAVVNGEAGKIAVRPRELSQADYK